MGLVTKYGAIASMSEKGFGTVLTLVKATMVWFYRKSE